MKVFLCHSSTQKPLIREMCNYFPQWMDCWLDENKLLFGENFELSIKKTINIESDYVVLFLNNSAVHSNWVKKEIKWALQREEELGRVFLLPITMGNITNGLEELGLSGKIAINLTDYNNENIQLLAKKIVDQVAGWMAYRINLDSDIKNKKTERVESDNSEYMWKIREINNYLNNTPEIWRKTIDEFLLTPYLRASQLASIGEIPVNSNVYYQSILSEMDKAESGSEVYAVSTLSSDLWNRDEDQTDYAEKNFSAVTRGVRINRLFIYDGNDLNIDQIIQNQSKAGIIVRINRRASISVLDLEDIVIFKSNTRIRAYVCHRAIDYKRRVRSGKIILNKILCNQFLQDFIRAWNSSDNFDNNIQKNISLITGNKHTTAPGLSMNARQLNKEVVTCEEAAIAREIPLAQELKTLILDTSSGFIACHIPGDATLWLRAVKDFLESDEAYLIDPEKLLDIGLSPGTVSAVLEPVWSMPHLISKRVLKQEIVMTNNGTRKGYYSFNPSILTLAANYRIGDFEKINVIPKNR